MTWIASWECHFCGFSGPETEFMSVSAECGELAFTHRDTAPDGAYRSCVGCVTTMGRFQPDAIRRVVMALSVGQGVLL